MYIAAIVIAMFLAGCVLAVIHRRQKSQTHKKWLGVSGK
jgi:hypothetical protein